MRMLWFGQLCRLDISPCYFGVGRVSAGRRTVGITMSTEPLTPQGRRVLQVGPLKPSLVQTLRDDYAAYVLPDDPADREAFLF